MARVPGGLPNFGIGIFVAAGIVPDVTTTPYWGQSSGENIIRLELVVYDQTSTPVYIPPPAATASVPLAYAHRETQAVVRRIVYDPTATPVIVPPTQTPSAFGYQTVDAAVLRQRKVLPDGLAVSLTSPAAATPVAPSDATAVRAGRVRLPDGYAAPVLAVFGVATPSAFAYQPVEATWQVQKKVLPDGFTSQFRILAATPSALGYETIDASRRQQRRVLPEGLAEAVSPPAAVTPVSSTPANAYREASAIVRRVIYDPNAIPVFVPPAVVAPVAGRFVPDASQGGFFRARIKPVPLSAFVFAYPVDDLAGDYSGQFIRPKRKVLPDAIAQPPFPPAFVVPTPISSTLASTHSSAIVVKSRVVYDPTAARPVFPPAPPPAAVTPSFAPSDALQGGFARPRVKPVPLSAFVFAYPVGELADDYSGQFIRRYRKVLPEGFTAPTFPPLAAPTTPTPSAFGYQPSDAVWRRQKKLLSEGFTAPVYPPVVVVVPPTFYQAEEGAPQRRISRPGIKLDLEGFERPLIQITITVTPSYLFETIAPPWTAKPNAVAIKTDLDGFEKPQRLPDPPTATTSILFDVIPPVQRTLPNRIAIKADLDGAVWPPQDPADLTGVPPVVEPPPGGGGGWRYPRFRKKKDWRDELQDLLADLLPPEKGEPAKPIPSYDPRPLEPRLSPAARQVEDLLKYIKDDALPSPELVIGPELLGRDALLSTTAALASLSHISLPQIIPEFDEDEDDEEAIMLLLAVLFE